MFILKWRGAARVAKRGMVVSEPCMAKLSEVERGDGLRFDAIRYL